MAELLSTLPKDVEDQVRTKENVITFIRENGKDPDILAFLG